MTTVLLRHNPLAFQKPGTAKDEYGGPVGALIERLDSLGDARQLQFWLHHEFAKFFGLQQAGDESRYRDIASQLWEAWTAFRRHGL